MDNVKWNLPRLPTLWLKTRDTVPSPCPPGDRRTHVTHNISQWIVLSSSNFNTLTFILRNGRTRMPNTYNL